MKEEIAIKTRALQKLVELVYVHQLPVHLTLAAKSTEGGLRILTIEYFDKEDEKLVEWLYNKATKHCDD